MYVHKCGRSVEEVFYITIGTLRVPCNNFNDKVYILNEYAVFVNVNVLDLKKSKDSSRRFYVQRVS